jgi:HTH-type transcriptional regulator/antitoxin HigA
MNDRTPPPGELIKTFLRQRNWTQADLAKVMDRPLPTVNEIISGKRQVTPETAIQLSVVFCNDPKEWMELEAAYRLSLIRSDEGSVRRRSEIFSLVPVQDMERRQWIRHTKTVQELEGELLAFFGVDRLEDISTIGAKMRHGSGVTTLNPAQLAWCYRARQLSRSVHAEPFSDDAFRNGTRELRHLATWPEEVRKVPRVLAEMGVHFVVIEPLPRSRVDGAAFWVGDQPSIAVSVRYDRVDSFWHTVGHELSHIWHRDGLGVDSDIVGEDRLAPAELDETELRAEREATAMLIDQAELDDFVVRVGPLYSRARINQFANRIRIHPGIIVGQLQHRGEISYATMRDQLVKVREIVTSEALTDGWGHLVNVKE